MIIVSQTKLASKAGNNGSAAASAKLPTMTNAFLLPNLSEIHPPIGETMTAISMNEPEANPASVKSNPLTSIRKSGAHVMNERAAALNNNQLNPSIHIVEFPKMVDKLRRLGANIFSLISPKNMAKTTMPMPAPI